MKDDRYLAYVLGDADAVTSDDYSLYQGDCLDVMASLREGSIDLCLTDPPYGTTACKWDSVIPFEPMWGCIKRVVKPNAAVVLFGSQPFTSALVMSNPKMFKYTWVWDKKLPSGFQIAKFRPMMRHEDVSVFSVTTPKYRPIKTPQKKRLSGGFKKSSESSPLANVDGEYREHKDKYPQSIIEFYKRDGKSLHPTQKPVALLEYLIKTYTDEGDTVLDFTMGSGSTGVAALNTGRKFIGIELDPGYFDIAVKRIQQA